MNCKGILLAGLLVLGMGFWAGRLAGREVTASERKILAAKEAWRVSSYPIGFWNYLNLANPVHAAHQLEADVEQWHDAGFTLTFGPSFDPADEEQLARMHRLLDWAQQRGIKLILVDPRGGAIADGETEEAYLAGFRKAVDEFGRHPAAFGFHIGDEPDAAANGRFLWTSRKQRELAPDLVPFINLLPWWEGAEQRVGTGTWPEYLDRVVLEGDARLLCYDHYAQLVDAGGVEGYFRNLKLYRDAAMRHEIPFWNTLGSVGHWLYREPDYNDMRWQFNTTVCSGAGGVLWFFYYMREPHENYRLSPVDEFWEPTRGYYDIRRVHRMFHQLYGDLFNRLVSTKVMFYPEGRGGFDAFQPDHLVKSVRFGPAGKAGDLPNSLMIGEFVDAAGTEYLMLVNNSPFNDVKISVELANPDEVEFFRRDWYHAGGENLLDRWVSDDGNQMLEQFLAPGQEIVLRAAPKGER